MGVASREHWWQAGGGQRREARYLLQGPCGPLYASLRVNSSHQVHFYTALSCHHPLLTCRPGAASSGPRLLAPEPRTALCDCVISLYSVHTFIFKISSSNSLQIIQFEHTLSSLKGLRLAGDSHPFLIRKYLEGESWGGNLGVFQSISFV